MEGVGIAGTSDGYGIERWELRDLDDEEGN